MKCRWDNAPTVEDWERRLIMRNPSLGENDSYRIAQGSVSRNLTYCQLLSGRYSLSRNEAKKYGIYFKLDAIGKMMKIARHSVVLWWMLGKFLQYREGHRFRWNVDLYLLLLIMIGIQVLIVTNMPVWHIYNTTFSLSWYSNIVNLIH